MTIPTWEYDRCFEGGELRRIHRLRALDRNRSKLAWVLGAIVFGTILALASAWNESFSAAGFWVGLLAGAGGGAWLYHYLDTRIENEFIVKWDPLFQERSPLSLPQIAAREDIIRLTDSMHFYGLTDDQQRAAIHSINKKHGLEQ